MLMEKYWKFFKKLSVENVRHFPENMKFSVKMFPPTSQILSFIWTPQPQIQMFLAWQKFSIFHSAKFWDDDVCITKIILARSFATIKSIDTGMFIYNCNSIIYN